MAEIKTPQKVLPFAGLIFRENFPIGDVFKKLKDYVGDVLSKSSVIPFTHTTYYNKEMGDKLLRQWCIFENLIMPDVLIQLKLKANDIEQEYLNDRGGRQINIDPGLLSLDNLVLASTKNYSHRLYLGSGIYGEVTLIYRNNCFNLLEWTFPDYREKTALDFFSKAREILKKRLAGDLSR